MTIHAFPYRRYSSGKQGAGNSLARQAEPFEALCARMGWLPDYSHGLTDKGRSGYKGDHVTRGRLGYFLMLAKGNFIRPGSILVIENQDRLSRQEVDIAREMVRDLLLCDVKIYDQDDGVLLDKNSLNDPLSLIRLILRMERAHKESKRKSELSSDNWDRKRRGIGGGKLTSMVPYWIEVLSHKEKERTVIDGYRLIEDRADMVRQVFTWCIEGVGIAAIAGRLNAAGVKTGRKGSQVGSSSVQKILRNRAVLGEFTPMSGRGKDKKPSGDPVPDYYPPVIDDVTWFSAQMSLNGRGFAKGRGQKKLNNLFAGIAFNARDGYKLTFRAPLPPRRPNAYLVSTGAIVGWQGSSYATILYDKVEALILGHLVEIDPSSVWPDSAGADRAKLIAIEQRLAEIKSGIANTEDMINADPGEVSYMKVLRGLVAQRNKLQAEYDSLNGKIKSPEVDTMRSVQEMLQTAPGGLNPTDEDTRGRLAAAIKRLVKEIWVLRLGGRQDMRYIVQVDYKNGERRFIWDNFPGEGAVKVDSALNPPDLAKFRETPGIFGIQLSDMEF